MTSHRPARSRAGPACPLLGLLVLGLLVLGVVWGSVGTAEALPRPNADYDTGEAVTVQIIDNQYSPQTLIVDPGTMVEWVNKGRNHHNVIANERSRFRSGTLNRGETFEQRFIAPGRYGYYCSFHGAPGRGQYGTVIVRNPDGTLPAGTTGLGPSTATSRPPRTVRVPKDAATIQAAVDRARAGDMVLVAPGVYREAVTVTTDRLVIRGVDRNRTILDGRFRLDNGIRVLDANGVAVENLTARNFTTNGFFWSGVNGYRGSYLTAVRNGDYGIYAFDSINGQFDHAYASGSPDAGYYIGQCFPCNALITNVIAEWNGIGYSGTNAGGNLFIVQSVWRHNRAGIVPNSGNGEANPPERETTIVGNLVYDNNNAKTPAIDDARLAMYNGILITGGNQNVVQRNRVFDHRITGIGLVPKPDETIWLSNNNVVRDNSVRRSGLADLGVLLGVGNCFAGNDFRTSAPPDIETVMPCPGTPAEPPDQLDAAVFLADRPPSVDYRRAKLPKPPKLPNMPRARRAQPRPATDVPTPIDLSTVRVPKASAR